MSHTIRLQSGDWFERDGKWYYTSADGLTEVGPFWTEKDAKEALLCAAIHEMLE